METTASARQAASGEDQIERFGGCAVRRLGHMIHRSTPLAAGPYHYEALVLAPGDQVERPLLGSAALWMLEGEAVVLTPDGSAAVPAGSAALIESGGLSVSTSVRSVMLLAGVEAVDADGPRGVRTVGADEIKLVEKPWGEERWINGRSPGFAFKRIVLRAGFKTSLQYHEMKQETNLLLDGAAKLHHAVSAGDHEGPTAAEPICGVTAVDIEPEILHRIEAVTDLVLFEVSTPHLDDVIRISDDAGRPDGYIPAEHGGGG
ncbi:MAG: hypothetical protein AAGB51_01410 [Planctomycetota bacterium]